MPITYATPEPFAPGISSAYGTAMQRTADNPALISASGQANQLQAQNAARADQLRFAYAQASAENWDRQAQRYFLSDAANVDREQGAMNLGATLTQRNEEAALHENAASDRQRQGAALSNWLGQQDLSQKESLRLQQMKAAVADVQASNLTPDQKQDTIMRLRTGIDPLEQRMKMSQAKTMELHGRLYEKQLEQEAQRTETMAKVNNMTAGQRIHYEVPQEISDKIEEAVNQQQNLTPQERDREIQRLKRRYPGADQFLIEPDGKLVPVPKKTEKLPEFDHKAAEAMAIAEAEAAHPPKAALEGGKPEHPAEFYQKKFEVLKRLAGEHDQMHGIQRPQPAAPPPNEFQKQLVEDNKPFKLGEGTKEQNEAVKGFGDFRANIAQVPGLDPQKVQAFQSQATVAMQLLSQYGSVVVMPPKEKSLFMAIARSIENVAPLIKAAEANKKREPAGGIYGRLGFSMPPAMVPEPNRRPLMPELFK